MARLPEGTITFLLTDLQGSTQAWEKLPKGMRSAMKRHDAILATTVGDHGGDLVEAGREGDSVLAVFRTAATAAACALEIQKSFDAESWPEGLDLKVRVALHTGEAQLRDGHYFGPALNRCARLLATCHPGQILLTNATQELLADELPEGAELRDLGQHRFKDLTRPEHVFQLTALGRTSEFPRIQSLPQLQTNLPRYLTNFVGREADLSALQSLLAASRMVTLVGAGGSGKTRLAAELGRASLSFWPGGIWWVELEPVSDANQLPSAVVASLELPGRGPALDVVTSWLAARRAVLILDNCEHMIAASAEFCDAALQRCQELTIIATSREPLGLAGEARWLVSSMAATDGVELFEARARLVRRAFQVNSSNHGTVTEICERLDGLPLAIELAAARVGMMTEQEILGQLADRFRLLTGGSRTAAERQQTMIATIDWSYRLLKEEEALLFCRLSVFRGGFTLESALAICAGGAVGSILDGLYGLVQKSMVVVEEAGNSGTRYRLLESQLAYADGRLQEFGERESMQRRHYEHFNVHLHSISKGMLGVADWEWMAREAGNLWVAMEWARDNTADLGLSFALDLQLRDLTQARKLLADRLEQSPALGALRVTALGAAAYMAWGQLDFDAALEAAESGVLLARELADPERLAMALHFVGMAHQGRGEYAAAEEIYREATDFLRGSSGREWIVVRNSVGMLAVDRGDFTRGAEILAECVAMCRDLGDIALLSGCVDSLACAQLGLRDYLAAVASWRESLGIGRRVGGDLTIFAGLEGMSCIASAVGDDVRAVRLAAAANAMSRARSLGSDPWLFRQTEESTRRSRSRLGTRKSEDAWNQGSEMSVDMAIDYALVESELDSAADSGPLSRRQCEVATLVAGGLTNREIGQRLFITERSAEGHVERIRNKLGVRSRTEVATWAVEHGLTDQPKNDKERGTRRGPLATGRGQQS
jgi:predicted ATPase/class 3 adenylate cyclase/DNA-binding CsgD family transcriptional regulator